YSNYRIIYINDASLDETGESVEELVKQFTNDYQVISFDCIKDTDVLVRTKMFSDLVNREKHFFTLVNNKYRYGCLLANLYPAVHSSSDEEIIVIVDGDDWLFHDNVLQEVNALYASGNIWLTHGRFIEYPNNQSNWSLKVPKEIIQQNAFRQSRLPSHLRTFYSWLFKKIQLSDLMYQGSFYPMTGDMAMMFPMIEMAGERHGYIEKINYVYNIANPINDNRVNRKLQNDLDAHIRKLSPYQRLSDEEVFKVD
ncbi:MAG: hypothetical protein JSS09_01435, partial [Verrucomicrobia bacterium]|nr:hypothetical protein [Verrucomicrobiota bacterium]